MPITEGMIIKSVSKIAFDVIGAIVSRYKNIEESRTVGKVKILSEDMPRAVSTHLKEIKEWADEIVFREMLQSKPLINSFVELDLNLKPTRMRSIGESSDRSYRISELLSYSPQKNIVLLGEVGAGKTTSFKKLIIDVLEQSNPSLMSHIPILIRFRRLDQTDTITATLLRILGIHIDYANEKIPDNTKIEFEITLLSQIFDKLPAVIFLDGLDEAPSNSITCFLDEFEQLLLRLTTPRFFMSCRSASYRSNLPHVQILEIAPLSDDQIEEFATKWLGEKRASHLLHDIKRSPYSGTEVRPLTLAHLCAIYERKGSIPHTPKLIYKTIVRLLLSDWDEQRRIKRGSDYENFTVDQKEEFLEAVAFDLYVQGIRAEFTHDQLRFSYRKLHERFGLPANHEELVAREIESHTGLIVEYSYSTYQFSHLSLQEYLAAQYIVKLPRLPWDISTLLSLPEPLAIATALSSHPATYFIEIIRVLIANSSKPNLEAFCSVFLKRIIVEKPSFMPDYALGASIIYLFVHAHGPERQRLEQNWSLDAFHSFMKLPEIQLSLKDFSKYWHAEASRSSFSKIIIDNDKFRNEYDTDLSEVLRLESKEDILLIANENLTEMRGELISEK